MIKWHVIVSLDKPSRVSEACLRTLFHGMAQEFGYQNVSWPVDRQIGGEHHFLLINRDLTDAQLEGLQQSTLKAFTEAHDRAKKGG